MHIAGIKMKGVEPPSKKPLKLKSQAQGMKLQALVFDLPGFSLSLMQYFFTVSPLLPSEWECIVYAIGFGNGYFAFWYYRKVGPNSISHYDVAVIRDWNVVTWMRNVPSRLGRLDHWWSCWERLLGLWWHEGLLGHACRWGEPWDLTALLYFRSSCVDRELEMWSRSFLLWPPAFPTICGLWALWHCMPKSTLP